MAASARVTCVGSGTRPAKAQLPIFKRQLAFSPVMSHHQQRRGASHRAFVGACQDSFEAGHQARKAGIGSSATRAGGEQQRQ